MEQDYSMVPAFFDKKMETIMDPVRNVHVTNFMLIPERKDEDM